MRKKILFKIFTLLLALAPIMALRIESAIFWGEPEIPACMKEKNSDKFQ